MNRLPIPGLSYQGIFDDVTGVADGTGVSARTSGEWPRLDAAYQAYLGRAHALEFHRIPENTQAVGRASASDMVALYERLARRPRFYDELKAVALDEKCPYCGIDTVAELDHYVPKSKFIEFAIAPANLVPVCARCNGRKHEIVPVSHDEQILHPYFDRAYDVRWLMAEILPGPSAVARYLVDPQAPLGAAERSRVEYHFSRLDLGRKMGVNAGSALAGDRHAHALTYQSAGANGLKSDLERLAQSRLAYRTNGWDTALYEALSRSDWYCNGGFIT